jgi:hypothetical protein
MHELVVHPCLFGCEGQNDDLAHYLRCENLWQLLQEAEQPGHADMPSLSERLLFINPRRDSARNLVIMFLAYHSVKHGNLGQVLNHIGCQDFFALDNLMLHLIRAAALQATSTSKPCSNARGAAL